MSSGCWRTCPEGEAPPVRRGTWPRGPSRLCPRRNAIPAREAELAPCAGGPRGPPSHRARRRRSRRFQRIVEHASRDLLRLGGASPAAEQAQAPLPHSLQEAGSSHRHDEVARQEARLPSAALGRDGHHQSLLVTKILGEARDLVLEAELEAVRGRCRHRLPQLSLRHVRPLPGETGPRPTHDDVNRRRR